MNYIITKKVLNQLYFLDYNGRWQGLIQNAFEWDEDNVYELASGLRKNSTKEEDITVTTKRTAQLKKTNPQNLLLFRMI